MVCGLTSQVSASVAARTTAASLFAANDARRTPAHAVDEASGADRFDPVPVARGGDGLTFEEAADDLELVDEPPDEVLELRLKATFSSAR